VRGRHKFDEMIVTYLKIAANDMRGRHKLDEMFVTYLKTAALPQNV